MINIRSIVHRFTKVAVVITYMLAIVSALVAQPLSVSDLKTEYLSNPVGLDKPAPRFSWILESTTRGMTQSAYQIVVAKNKKDLIEGRGIIWDSQKVISSHSVNIHFAGKPLKGGEKYYWRVRVWDKNGKQSDWSRMQTFQMGILDENSWRANWITHPDTAVSSAILRKQFRNIKGKEIKSAYVYVTGVGYYELYLNGEKVENNVLDPALTDYRKRVLYKTFDISTQLNSDENTIGLMLGNGAFRITEQNGRYAWGYHSFGAPRGFVQLHIKYNDGTTKTIISDSTWKASSGPITYNNFYGGEDYDARLEQEGWKSNNFDDSSWSSAKVLDQYNVILDSQLMPPIRVVQTISPKKQTNPDKGVYLYDLEQNIAGWWRIRVKGKRGTKLRIRGAETLNDSIFPTPLISGDSLSTRHEYHSKVWTTYTLKGDGVESFEPRFFYTGFRYIEVKTDNPDQLELLEVDGRVVHSDLQRSGSFSSSDTLLNKIYRAAVWSQRSNLHSIPTDCPHREKGGYNGDGQVIAETSIHDFHIQPFYEKWLNDMSDAQEDNGRIPNTSPTIVGGYGGGIAWGSAYVLIPWWMYQYYEDKGILRKHYTGMKSYLGYLRNLAENDDNPGEEYVINEFGGYWDSLGEWCAPGEDTDTNNPLVNTYYWYLTNKTFADIAGVLDRPEDRKKYLAIADSVKRAFNKKFFDSDSQLYGSEEPYQSYLLFALDQNLVPDEYREDVLNQLITDIMITREGHLGTGILGTKHLFRVLANEGREDVLHTMVTKTSYPSWGYWLKNGATTLWERWNGKNSHNHQMFGSVNEYFYKYLAGIRGPTDTGTETGYKKVLIKPFIPRNLKRVEASLKTVRGDITSQWEQNDDGLTLEVSLPANTNGWVSIPIDESEQISITENGKKTWKQGKFVKGVEGILDGLQEDGYITFKLASGKYKFYLSFSD